MSEVVAGNAGSRLRYIPALDGMRGLSLPGTILTHYALFLEFNVGAPHWLRSVGPLTLNIQMFFVLSGALITSLLVAEHQRTGTVSLKKFYLRRSRRLGPALLATVVLIGLVELFWWGSAASSPLGSHPWLALGAVMVFVGNWVLFRTSGGIGWLGPAWTLGIEEQFYLTWPALLVLALRRRLSRGALYFCFAVVLTGGLFAAAALESHVGKWRAFYATPVQLPSILFGCVLGYELTSNPTGRLARLVRSRVVALTGFAGMVTVSIYLSHHPAPLYKGGYAVYATFACLLIGHCFVRAAEPTLITKVLGWKPFVVVGQVSYEAYLIHVIVIIGMARAFPTVRVYPMMAIDTIVVALISAVFYYSVEQPIRKLGWKSAFRRRERPAGGVPVFAAPGRRLALASGLAGVIALAGVGVVAARTTIPKQERATLTAGGASSSRLGGATDAAGAGHHGGRHATSLGNGGVVGPAAGSTAGDTTTGSGQHSCAGLQVCSSAGGGTVPQVLAAPRITALTPATGSVLGGTMTTITGRHFTRDAKVFFDSTRVHQVTRIDSRTIRIVTPSAQSVAVSTAFAQLHGLQVEVRVVTAGGASAAGVSGSYTYL
ncbi:MAG TPA: acyltransferase family protein [Mycobacteriales bacterium]|nr:acyltransferase family protein [Mycobacteriales bacterium]